MKYCNECQTVEGKSHEEIDDQGYEVEVCNECESQDSIQHYNEDEGYDR